MDPSFNTDSLMYQPNYLDATCTTVSSVCRSPVFTTCTMIGPGFYAYSILLRNGNSTFIQPFGCLDANCNQCELDASILPNALAKSPTDCFADTGSTSYQLYFLANKTSVPTVFPNGSLPFGPNQVVTPSSAALPPLPSEAPSNSGFPLNITLIIVSAVGAVCFALKQRSDTRVIVDRESPPLDQYLPPPRTRLSSSTLAQIPEERVEAPSASSPKTSATRPISVNIHTSPVVPAAMASPSYALYPDGGSIIPAAMLSSYYSKNISDSPQVPHSSSSSSGKGYSAQNRPTTQFIAIQNHDGYPGAGELSFTIGQGVTVFQVLPSGWAMSQNNETLAFGFAPVTKLRAIEDTLGNIERTQSSESRPPRYSM
ncbi:uncharacterized protein BJ171DRAFT_475214 [Polychytrium aggregatum]|uniref:uncharacterized protein n=1 Tax=Polychytrium aggregatum TaxID=110093 RepID=UPI0022FEEEDC|nr:uncharacterized protein BJ171DRAFT_475214 [Polychytrium aggregatum]KAI9204236.1 hypothetical protein BJ171DRAFT_475214 [Polychytrium aggregatum]